MSSLNIELVMTIIMGVMLVGTMGAVFYVKRVRKGPDRTALLAAAPLFVVVVACAIVISLV